MENKIISKFFNRLDCFGSYQTTKQGEKANALTSKNMVTAALVASHMRGEVVLGAHATSKENTCKWLAFDFDCTKQSKQEYLQGNIANLLAEKATLFIYVQLAVMQLKRHGINAVIEDSVGGYHVWIFLDATISTQIAFEFLSMFKATYLEKFLPDLEIFPKQANVDSGGFGNWPLP